MALKEMVAARAVARPIACTIVTSDTVTVIVLHDLTTFCKLWRMKLQICFGMLLLSSSLQFSSATDNILKKEDRPSPRQHPHQKLINPEKMAQTGNSI
eukprot:1643207-Amphidinium_carterae.1